MDLKVTRFDLCPADPRAAAECSEELVGAAMQQPDYAVGVAAMGEKRARRFGRA